MFSQIKDRIHIEQNFHSVAWVMPQEWDLGVLDGSKSLARGFAMAPHRLRRLVYIAMKIIFLFFSFRVCQGDGCCPRTVCSGDTKNSMHLPQPK